MPSQVQKLGHDDLDRLRQHLTAQPAQNLYLLGILAEFGVANAPGQPPFAFLGLLKDGQLKAVLFVGGPGGLMVPAGVAEDIAEIARVCAGRLRLRACLGEARAVEVLVSNLCASPPRTQRSQRLFQVSADDLGPFTNPTLRLATEHDVPALTPLAAGFVKEAYGLDPLADDAAAFSARVLKRVRAERTYVLEENGELVFKLEVGSRSEHGAELEGIYTAPAHRGRQVATLCLGQISRHLLSSLPRLTLRIDEKNRFLERAARKVGYVPGPAQRLILSD